jgi:hypothetical protein
MFTALKHLFTGVDNQTWDIGRILWAKITLVYCVISGYHVVMQGAFDPQNWAIGASAILAGGGGALSLKAKTEPGNADPAA